MNITITKEVQPNGASRYVVRADGVRLGSTANRRVAQSIADQHAMIADQTARLREGQS